MAATPSPVAAATNLGAIYVAVEAISERASDLFKANESDHSVYDLANLSGEIRILAAQLEDALREIGTALQNLSG